MMKILNATECPGTEDLLRRFEGLAIIDTVPPDRKTALEIIHRYDIYISTLKFKVDEEFLNIAVNLKAIFTPSTGTDHIDLARCEDKGVKVFSMKNDRDFLDNVTATAELALALLLGVVRKIPWSFQSALRGEWARDRYRGSQLSGKTCGILGYGRLGTIFASYARALRMNVIACDIIKIEDDMVEQVVFEELLARSDVLSIHVHLDDSTTGLINEAAFNMMKDGIVIINTSRGAVIDEAALVNALNSGKVRAVGLDVINGEWDENLAEHPLIKYANTHENLLISTHIGGVCHESQLMAMEHTLGKVYKYIDEIQNGRATENE